MKLPNGFVDHWKTLHPTVRRSMIISIVLGFASLITGILLEDHEFWNSRPFVTNVASTLTGAFFGIPLAVFVLQWLTQDYAKTADRRTTLALISKSIDRISQNIKEFIKNEAFGFELLSERFSRLDNALFLFTCYPCEYREARKPYSVYVSDGGIHVAASDIRESAKEVADIMDELKSIILENFTDLKNNVRLASENNMQWRSLMDDIRPKWLECGEDWLPATTTTRIESLVSNGQYLYGAYSLVDNESYVQSFIQVIRRLSNYPESVPDREIDKLLKDYGEPTSLAEGFNQEVEIFTSSLNAWPEVQQWVQSR